MPYGGERCAIELDRRLEAPLCFFGLACSSMKRSQDRYPAGVRWFRAFSLCLSVSVWFHHPVRRYRSPSRTFDSSQTRHHTFFVPISIKTAVGSFLRISFRWAGVRYRFPRLVLDSPFSSHLERCDASCPFFLVWRV